MTSVAPLIVDLSWTRLTPTVDLFEVVWQIVFTAALFAAGYNWYDARLYLEAMREGIGGTGLGLVAPKDWRAARFGLGKAVIGFALGIAFLRAPSAALAGDAQYVLPAVAVRLGLITLGVLVSATAINDFVFRRKLARVSIIRRRGGPHQHQLSGAAANPEESRSVS